MFDRYHQMDDVRALCIGAFWLTELSWKLSGHAVRIATEMGIHQSFRKALAGSPEHFERARLWYLLYICDHHFSIAYGRPPVIHDHEPMRKYELYLQSSLAIEGDNRLISQVSLFVIMTRIYNCFEGEAEGEISDESLSQLAGFNEQLDNWRNTWRARLRRFSDLRMHNPSPPAPQCDISCWQGGGIYVVPNANQHLIETNAFVGDYSAKGVDLHYHFAKLQLNSLSLRGASTATINNLSPLRKEYANIAINSAASVLSVVLEESSIRDSLIGVPLYIDTMIAFAAVFLLKVTARWKGVGFSSLAPTQVWTQVGMVIELLKEKQAGEQHIIHQVSVGLEKMLNKCVEFSGSSSPFDDSRFWGNTIQSNHNSHSPAQILTPRSLPPYHEVPVYMQEGYPQQQQHQHQQQQQQQQPPPPQVPVDSSGQPLYPQVPIYDVSSAGPNEQQYFPIHMGTYDFLSPQLPY